MKPRLGTGRVHGGFTLVDVADEEAASFWAGQIAVARGWPQEVRPFGDADRARHR
jgi:hypothetical protein